MKFEKVSFNEKFWKTKTEAEFIAHESHHGLSEKQLKEAFALMNPPGFEYSPSASKGSKGVEWQKGVSHSVRVPMDGIEVDGVKIPTTKKPRKKLVGPKPKK